MELVLYFLFIHFTLLILGYVFIHYTKLFKGSPAAILSLGYVASIVFTAILATLHYALNVPTVVIQLVFWIALSASLFFLIKDRLYIKILQSWIPLLAFVVMSGFTLCFTFLNFSGSYSIIPDPEPIAGRNYDTLNIKVLNVAHTRANDNYIPYRQAQFFVNRSDPATDSFIDEWGVHFFQRTPLMGAVTANYFLAFDNNVPIDYTWSSVSSDPERTYEKFQIISQILNSMFIVPAFFLIRKIFNKKTAILSLLFLIPSQFFLYNALFSWPKSMVAFFILLSWYLLIVDKRFRYVVAATVASGLAYLTHDLAVLYVGATFVFLLVNRRFRDGFVVAFGSALFALPWLFLSSVVYHRPSSFIYYPISTQDIPQPGKIKETIAIFLETSPLKLLMIRIESLFYLLSPYQLIFDESNQSLITRIRAMGIFSIPGALGLGLVIPAIAGFFRRIKLVGILSLIFVPLILCVIVIGWPKGLGALHFAQAVVVLLTGLSVFVLSKMKRGIWLYSALAINTVQLVILVWSSYYFSINLADTKNIVLLSLMTLIIAGCFAGIYLTQRFLPSSKKHAR
jgi:hypothetical protein